MVLFSKYSSGYRSAFLPKFILNFIKVLNKADSDIVSAKTHNDVKGEYYSYLKSFLQYCDFVWQC